jgi:hypothetical protein
LVSQYPAHVDWEEHLGIDPSREMQASQGPTKPLPTRAGNPAQMM